MNILCKLLGHKTFWSSESAFRDEPCKRKGCSYIEKGLKYPPMPECKPPKKFSDEGEVEEWGPHYWKR